MAKWWKELVPGGEGLVIDHFSDAAIGDYLKHFDEAFKGYALNYLRGYFNDSYEVDDAKGQSDWTPDFFNQFKIRRGYDLKEYLPAPSRRIILKETPVYYATTDRRYPTLSLTHSLRIGLHGPINREDYT